MEAEGGINVKLDVSGARRDAGHESHHCQIKTRQLVIQLGTTSLTIFRIPVLENH